MKKHHTTDSDGAAVRPPWTRVTLEEAGRGIRLILPGVGFWRSRMNVRWLPAQSLFWIGAIFCVFAAMMTAFFLLAAQEASGRALRVDTQRYDGG